MPQKSEKFTDSQGGRLEEFYLSKSFQRKGFAEFMGVSYDRVTKWVNDDNDPPSEFWRDIKEKFPDADVGYILTGIKGMLDMTRMPRIPLLNEIPAGPINFHFADEAVLGYLITDNTKDKDLFALRVKGESMAPEINSGDAIVLAPHRPFVNGRVYAVITQGSEATVKRVFKEPGGYRLQPDNPEYESSSIQEKNVLRLIRVIEVRKML